MHIVLAGGTGFLGQAVAGTLQRDGHSLTVLTRRPPAQTALMTAALTADATAAPPAAVTWTPNGEAGPWASVLDGADVVINLAGEPIAGGRWSAARKQRIADSRILATRSITAGIAAALTPPRLLLNASGVGYYGPCGDEVVTESHAAGDDFLGRVCVEWEAAAGRAETIATRVICIRTGLVLDRGAGALPQIMLPFRFGLGGPLGSGRQFMPWIHRDDWVGLVRYLVSAPGASGPINASAPGPVTNAEFTRVLAKVLHRPALLPAPAFALRLALGEMADALLLSGQRAVPAAAERMGYRFTYPDLQGALTHLLG